MPIPAGDLDVTSGSAWVVACASGVLRHEGTAVSATNKAKDKAEAAKGEVKKGDPQVSGIRLGGQLPPVTAEMA
jgi:hypothetical protein